MTALTLSAEPGVRTALASLPITLALAAGDADLHALDGGRGWTERAAAAIAAGARGILVVRPSTEPRAALTALAERAAGIPIVLDTRWRHNAAVGVAAERFGALTAGSSLLEASAVVAAETDVDDAMRDLAVLAQATAGPVGELRSVGAWPGRRVAMGRVGALAVRLSVDVTRAGAGSARLRALGENGGVDLWVPDAGTARAAQLTVTDPSGCVLLPTRYESAHRAALRGLAEVVQDAGTVADLDEFRRVLEAAEPQP